ncbi:MAG TPA: hypothetical protein VEJ20_02910 [Candidatus Eremiobacteraceae bacterium]|nr:hypothetical protein [Candidatus Eremiobacteraceae bacterium]
MSRSFRVRYKVLTSFALFVLAAIAIVRLWGAAPPSGRTAAAYATVTILACAALWRGILFARAARGDIRP